MLGIAARYISATVPFCFIGKDAGVSPFIGHHHRLHGESPLDVRTTDGSVDGWDLPQRSDRFLDAVDEDARAPVIDHFPTRPQVHGDYWHAGGIRLGQDQSKPLGDRIQVQQPECAGEQSVLPCDVDRSDVTNVSIIEMGFYLLLEVGSVLNDSRNQQRKSALSSYLNGQMHAFVRMNATEENELVASPFTQWIKGEIDPVVDRADVI